MRLPADVQATIERYVARYPIPPKEDDSARDWMHRLCEQVVYEYPKDGYTHKQADPGRPHSSDVLAQHTPNGLIGWDLVVGMGTSNPRLDVNAESIDLRGQTPEPASPVNHLQATVPPLPTQPPFPPLPPTDFSAVLEAVRHTAERVDEIAAQLHEARAEIAKLDDDVFTVVEKFTQVVLTRGYRGETKFLGRPVVFHLTPEE